MDSKKCYICGKKYVGFGNNPWLIKKSGKFCDKRNVLVVKKG